MTYTEIKKAPLVWAINQRLIPTTQIDFSEDSLKLFNSIVKRCVDEEYELIVRTALGNISYSKTICPAYDVRATRSLAELTVLNEDGMFRLQVRTVNSCIVNNEEVNLSGWKSFIQFKALCKEHGIDLNDYTTDDGANIKKQIEKYIIKGSDSLVCGKTYFNANHIDFHSSFPAGLVNTHPEFKDVIEKLYEGRKTNPEYKYILNSTIGYMQSVPCCKAKWAILSRDAINDNNKRIRELSKRLEDNGCEILAYNTDGIWFTGDFYETEGSGKKLGDWEIDHSNCMIRFKSAGSYEFIDESGKYNPVVRGRTLLDEVKSREEWTWGDIFQKDAVAKKIILDENGFLSTNYLDEEN